MSDVGDTGSPDPGHGAPVEAAPIEAMPAVEPAMDAQPSYDLPASWENIDSVTKNLDPPSYENPAAWEQIDTFTRSDDPNVETRDR